MSSGNLKAGERRHVTVLFADMKGFTALSERMDPEEVDALMTRLFGAFEAIISGYGGIVEKYIGDALVAVFGVPELHEDDPSRAVSSALDVIATIDRINAERAAAPDIAFRIGIHTGLITTGKRGEFDVVTGHALSVASRIQSHADANSVLVSEDTKERTDGDFTFGERRSVAARGKEDPVAAYRVIGRKARPVEDDTIFVGRKTIVDSVFRSYLRHDVAVTGGVVLTGPAGIGKSRIAQAVIERINQLPDFSSPVLYVRALRYRTTPFAAVTDMLSGCCGITAAMDPQSIATRVSAALDIDAKSAEGFARLARGGADESDNQAFVLLYLVLKSIIRKNADAPYPPLVCMENLFFIDKNSLDFIAFYLKNADVKPFFLCTDRSPSSDVLQSLAGLDVAEVPPLDREQTLELIHAVHPAAIEDAVTASILEHAGGNPLFIREYARYASENRDIGSLPSTIQNIFLTSIEVYEPPQRDLLKKLAVFVHSFSADDAAYVQSSTQADPSGVADALARFVQDGVLVVDGPLHSFRYDLFKKALYSSLLNFNKRILHRVVADRMIANGSPHHGRLLHHLVRAEEYERASDYLEQNSVPLANMDLIDFIDPLIEHYAGLDANRQITLMFVKSAILFNNGVTERVDSLLKEIVEMSIRHRSHLFAGNAYHLLTAYNLKSYSFGKARSCGRKAIEHYELSATVAGRRQNVLELMASAEMLANQTERRDELVDRIRAIPESDEGKFSRTRLVSIEGEHHIMRGEYRAGFETLESARRRCPKHSETWYGVTMLAAMAAFFRCDWEHTVEIAEEALSGPSRHLSNISQLHARIGLAHHYLGDAQASDRSLQQAEFTASQIRNDFDRVDALRTLSACWIGRGDVERAREPAEVGVSTGLRHSATFPVLTLLMVLAEIADTEKDGSAHEYYMKEASLLIDSGMLLPSRALILYHHYESLLVTAGEADVERDALRAAVDYELSGIGDDRLIDRFCALPTIGPIVAAHRTPRR